MSILYFLKCSHSVLHKSIQYVIIILEGAIVSVEKKFNFDDISKILSALPASIKQEKLSVLLPVYNESQLITQNIRFLDSLLRSWAWNYEIIASNDGSKDDSAAVIENLSREIPNLITVSSSRNFGKGRALVTAFEASSGSYILFLDSDLELPAEHIPYFFQRMLSEGADIVIGSKKDKLSDLFYPASRRLFSNIYFFMVKLLFGLPVKDTQTGIKLFKRDVLETSLPFLLVKRFAFDIELLVLCHKQGAKIVSHPVIVRYIRDGIGLMGLNTILHMIKDTGAVFWRLYTRFWKKLPQGKKPLVYAVVSLGSTQTYMGNMFSIETEDAIFSLLPQLEPYDVVIFLRDGEELSSFMGHTLDRIFYDSQINAVVPLLYSKSEQGLEAKRYYILANAFYRVGAYARFRPVRAHFFRQSFPLCSCTLRVAYLKELLSQKQKVSTIRVSQVYYSPFFFIYKCFNQTDWHYIHTQENKTDGYRFWAFAGNLLFFLALFQVVLSLTGKTTFLIFLQLWIALEIGILLWFMFSLGIRRGFPFYIFFCHKRIEFFLKILYNKH